MVRLNTTSGEIEFINDSGEIEWSGKPLGHEASVVLPVVGSVDAIVLLNPDACMTGPFRNLLRVSADGSVSWRAALPDSREADKYVAVRWLGTQLVANTWNAYSVCIDPIDGQILDSLFTK